MISFVLCLRLLRVRPPLASTPEGEQGGRLPLLRPEPPPSGWALWLLATPRVIGRALPGTRHPVIVSDPVDPPRAMLTGDAVLHGTSEAPCAAGFEVSVVRAGVDRGADERGVVLLDDLEHAWLVRRVDAPDGGLARVEYRGMSCRFEPGLEIPDELLGEPAVGDADR